MSRKVHFYKECIKYAWHSSIDGANAAAPIPGAVILYVVYFFWSGTEMKLPESMMGALELAAACLGFAWVIIFIIRLLHAPYLLWLSEREKVEEFEDKLKSKLRLEFDPNISGCMPKTSLGGITKALFVRVLPKCESSVTNCVGFLMGIFRLNNDEWEPTEFDERLDLTWSNKEESEGAKPVQISKGVQQYLDIFCIPETNVILPCTANNKIPNRAANVLNSTDTFRFDIGVMGDGEIASISLKVKLGSTWDTPQIEMISMLED